MNRRDNRHGHAAYVDAVHAMSRDAGGLAYAQALLWLLFPFLVQMAFHPGDMWLLLAKLQHVPAPPMTVQGGLIAELILAILMLTLLVAMYHVRYLIHRRTGRQVIISPVAAIVVALAAVAWCLFFRCALVTLDILVVLSSALATGVIEFKIWRRLWGADPSRDRRGYRHDDILDAEPV